MRSITSIVERQSLTSALELASVHCNHSLELCMLRAYSLGATEADIGEQLIQQHNRTLFSCNLTLAIRCNH